MSAPLRPPRVLGVDPGSRVTGWGLVTRDRGRYVYVDAGVIKVGDGEMAPRLLGIFSGLGEVIARLQPDCVALEAIFAHKSSTSALVLGQARGVAILAAARAGVPVHEYNAATMKKTVSGNGRADKAQMARAVGMLLGVPQEGAHDQADALALAITHLAHAGLRQALEAR